MLSKPQVRKISRIFINFVCAAATPAGAGCAHKIYACCPCKRNTHLKLNHNQLQPY